MTKNYENRKGVENIICVNYILYSHELFVEKNVTVKANDGHGIYVL